MSYKPLSAAAELRGTRCVVIERDENGNHVVYADPDVAVMGRFPDLTTKILYNFDAQGLPANWLDVPKENLLLEDCLEDAHRMLSAAKERELESKDDE